LLDLLVAFVLFVALAGGADATGVGAAAGAAGTVALVEFVSLAGGCSTSTGYFITIYYVTF